MATIPEALAIALQHQQAGRLQAAEQIYRQVLELHPDNVDAHNKLGIALKARGSLDEAIACYQHALELQPDFAEAQYNLGNALLAQKKFDEAIACYRRALELKPDFAAAQINLGTTLQGQGKLDEAIACLSRALELKPDHPAAQLNLGNAFMAQGTLEEAIACYRRALELQPNYAGALTNLGNALRDQAMLEEAVACHRRALQIEPDFSEAHVNLGNALKDLGKPGEAIASYRRALKLRPDYVEAHNNLGIALKDAGELDEAIACHRRALELQPDHAKTYSNLGNAFQTQGELDEAIACYRRALELKPDCVEAHNNLGIGLKDAGKLDEAVACYRRALELQPDYAEAHSNLVFAINYCSGYDAKAIYEEHRRWSQRFAEPLAKFIQPHGNERSAERRLRVGYVSPDFRDHVVGRFLLPLLEAHDHERFEICCYASVRAPGHHHRPLPDPCRCLARCTRQLRPTTGRFVRHDQIDILVDLAMHSANSRLLMFARKPAPVQVAYLAYPGTTGLSTMDYRLTDPYLDPPADDPSFYCEESIRLPETYWCYPSLDHSPAVNALPALQTGHITFGCLNNFCKVTEPTLAAWIGLLHALPGATLLLHARSGGHRDRIRDFFAEQGVSPERVAFADRLPLAQYFQLYHQIDVALDPFPYGGGTTTCDALWMGVPVVSLAGHTAVGRGGVSILSNVGLTEMVAHDSEQYIRIARELAGNLSRLSQLRATLRDRMLGSPLMNAPRFAHNVEAAYRTIWRRWCERQPAGDISAIHVASPGIPAQ